MPRAREFNESDALQKATITFWENGYEATSYDDLVNSTGVSRYGLYSAFGDKKEFFLRALDHYIENNREEMLGTLGEKDASLPDIFSYFGRLQDKMDDPEKRVGCMLCNTAIEMAQHDQEAEAKVNEIFSEIKVYFAKALTNAAKKGELAKTSNPDKLADYLVGLMMGGAMLVRSPMARQRIKNYIETGLSVFQ